MLLTEKRVVVFVNTVYPFLSMAAVIACSRHCRMSVQCSCFAQGACVSAEEIMSVTAPVFHKRIMFESDEIVCASRFIFLSVLTCHFYR
jgi:hypothetical protein